MSTGAPASLARANGSKLSCDRVDLVLPTPSGLATPRRELLPGGLIVVCEGAIRWTKSNRAHAWATLEQVDEVRSFPPALEVWGIPTSGLAFARRGIPFTALPSAGGLIMGPYRVPRPADAFFCALDYVCEHLGARKVRVHGGSTWNKPDRRWKRHALAVAIRVAGAAGIEIERAR